MSNTHAHILIVEDEQMKRRVLEDTLTAAGYSVSTAANPLEAEPLLQSESFDIVLSDLRMPGQDGLSFLRGLKERKSEQTVIIMTAYGTIDTAVEAMRLGAFDYIQKPFTTEELKLKLTKARQFEHLVDENAALRRELWAPNAEHALIGHSEGIRTVLDRIHVISGLDTTVLIEGESGTGKELVARIIHEASYRASGPFVPVACAALPRELVESELFGHEAGAFTDARRRRLGRFECAHGGTLFLDDVDDMPPQVQVKLLRVLQERCFERVGGEHAVRVNVRVIAATKKPLLTLVEERRFREDLYYRLAVVPVDIPPLRKRLDDIPFLVQHFVDTLAMKMNRGKVSVTPEVIAKLQRYDWPGNVRELEHVVERMIVLSRGDELREDDVPQFAPLVPAPGAVPVSLDGVTKLDLAATMAEQENRIIRWALDRCEGNLAQAAEALGVPRSTLQYKVSKLDTSEDGPRATGRPE